MSTKADFYVGTGKDAEWIGTLLKNGSVYYIPMDILIQVNKTMFEEMVLELLSLKQSVIPDKGDKWIHPWEDSRVTDYVYMFDNNKEKVMMYQCGIDLLLDPVKIIQGQSLSECIESYDKPEFPVMISKQYEITDTVNYIEKNKNMDLDIINKIKEYLDDCYLEYPKIKSSIDLTKFQRQKSDMKEFEYEFINQNPGGGITGDSFAGTIAFPIDKDKYLIIDYVT